MHLSARTVAAALSERTRAVVVPHEYGNTAPIDEIERLLAGRGIFPLDDAAQSFGTRRAGRPVGSFGNAGVVSVGILKALSGTGGAVVVTNDEALYDRLRISPKTTSRHAASGQKSGHGVDLGDFRCDRLDIW